MLDCLFIFKRVNLWLVNVQLNPRLITVRMREGSERTFEMNILFYLAQLKFDEIVTEGFCLRTQPIATPTVQNLLVGEYSLFWKRLVSLCKILSIVFFLNEILLDPVIQIFLNYVRHFH